MFIYINIDIVITIKVIGFNYTLSKDKRLYNQERPEDQRYRAA